MGEIEDVGDLRFFFDKLSTKLLGCFLKELFCF